MLLDKDRWQEIAEALSKNKLRTALTAFGVFWGIFMLVVMLGAGSGLRNGVMQSFGGFSNNALYLWTQSTTKAYKGFKPGRYFNMNNGDFLALKNNVSEINIICPRNQLGGYRGANKVNYGIKSSSFQIMGDYPEIFQIEAKKVIEGRFVNYNDLHQKRKVAVIGKRVKEVLFGEKNAINEYISINGIYFQVIGVYDVNFSGNNDKEAIETIYVPFTTFQQSFNFGDVVGWFSFTPKPGIEAEDLEQKILKLLKERHSVAPDDDRAFGYWNESKEFKKMSTLFLGIEVLIWIVGSGTLLAGVIGVSNIMLIVVKERTKEIGIRKSLGATPWNIISQILTEAVVLTSIAGYMGLVAAVGIIEAVNGAIASNPEPGMFRNPEVNFNVAVNAIIVLIVAGLFAGYIPARKAASISPVEALRYE